MGESRLEFEQMTLTGRQAPWGALRPWLVAGAGAIVLLTGYAAVQGHHRHWRDAARPANRPAAHLPVADPIAAKPARSEPRVNTEPARAETGTPAVPKAAAALAPVTAAAAEPPLRPSFDVVRVDVGGSAVFAGRGQPGADITVEDGGKALGQIKADSSGQWVFLPPAPLDPGSRELTL
jgi:hypothetical protein